MKFLTEVGEKSKELVLEDGAVLVLVIQLQDFNEVVEAAGVLGVLGLLEDGVEVVELDGLLSLLALTAQLSDGLQGGVEVAGAEEVADVEAIDLTVALEVIDLEGELDPYRTGFVSRVSGISIGNTSTSQPRDHGFKPS